MGAVSFRNIEPMTLFARLLPRRPRLARHAASRSPRPCNAFKATGRETIKAVSFYTSQHNVNYTIDIYSKFDGSKLYGRLAWQNGTCEFCGFHTIDLMGPVALKENDKFYICVEFSAGGHAFDRTSNIPVLLDQPPTTQQPPKKDDPKKDVQPQKGKGGKGKGGGGGGGGKDKPVVLSKANPGESFYFDGFEWKDLYNYTFVSPDWAVRANANFNHTANFCMKALTVKAVP